MNSQTTKRRPTGSVKSLSESLGISRRHCRDLLDAGMPLDPQSATRWRTEKLGTGDSASSAERLREERILLVKEQSRRTRLDADERARLLIPVAEVDERDTRIGFACRSAMMSLEHHLPAKLAGLSEPQIAAVLHQELNGVLEQLADEQSDFWKSFPTTQKANG